MVFSSNFIGNPLMPVNSITQKFHPKFSLFHSRPYDYSQLQKNPKNTIEKPTRASRPKIHIMEPIILTPNQVPPCNRKKKRVVYEERSGSSQVGSRQMLLLCGFGYWVQGFRCFPWLALNIHMAHTLNLHPSTLQLVQNSGNLPMVAKPLYGILSDALYISGAHRIPYIAIGVSLQVLSWGPLALIPVAGEALPTLLGSVLLGNLGASITEVAKDALVAEYGQKHKVTGLQSYAFMALAAGGILGNFLGGLFLLKTQPKFMFLLFAALLTIQFTMSITTREDSLGLPPPPNFNLARNSIAERIRKPYSDLKVAISEESIYLPLVWVVASIAMIPSQSGSIFCYQTQCLNLDPLVIGMSRLIGQLMLLSMTMLYERLWKDIPMRKLIGVTQILYAASLLLDLALVKEINRAVGISNEVFAACFSGLAETIAQFKLLPFQVYFASLAPPGCEGSLMSFLASALCLSSIFSGFLGVGFGSILGITSGDFSGLPMGIVIQFLAAFVPLLLINAVPMSRPSEDKVRKKGMSKRTRKNRRVGRLAYGSIYAYRRERESETQR